MSENRNIGQVISSLAAKAGVLATDPNLVNILSNAELSKITIHSDLVKSIDEGLLSLSQATDNHPVIQKHYHAQALNAFDKKMDEISVEAGLTEEEVADLKKITSTYKRQEALSAKIIAKGKEEAKGKSAEDKSALAKQNDELLAKLKLAEEATSEKVTQVENLRKLDRQAFELFKVLTGRKTIYDDLDPKIKQASIDAIINTSLQNKNAEFYFNDADELDIRLKDGSNLIGANHTKYTPQLFIDEALAQNKVLKVVEPPKVITQGGATITAAPSGPKGNNQTSSINRKLREAAEAHTN